MSSSSLEKPGLAQLVERLTADVKKCNQIVVGSIPTTVWKAILNAASYSWIHGIIHRHVVYTTLVSTVFDTVNFHNALPTILNQAFRDIIARWIKSLKGNNKIDFLIDRTGTTNIPNTIRISSRIQLTYLNAFWSQRSLNTLLHQLME